MNLNNFKEKKILVLGMKASGISASALLRQQGYDVTTFDDKFNLVADIEQSINGIGLIVISPGVANNHSIVKLAESHNIPIIGEAELGCQLLKSYIIAITGTNGKTTTVMMVEKVLSIMNKSVMMMGNIGYPISQVVYDKEIPDYSIIEMSSFQLETIVDFHPKISAILNIYPDHLDRYSSFSTYIDAKAKIFLNQTKDDFVILNYDCKEVARLKNMIKSQIKWVSTKEKIGDIYIKDNYYYLYDSPIMNIKDCKVRGDHNRFNFMVAMNVALVLGAGKDDLIALVKEFSISSHRIEYVSTIDGKTYFNDSKGTNVNACKTAINAIEGTMSLILGGSDKMEDFCDLFDEMDNNVKQVYVTGKNAVKIFNSACKVGFQNIRIVETLKEAILLASKDDVKNVLFSPASASFDRYKNYQERGDYFKGLVYEIKS